MKKHFLRPYFWFPVIYLLICFVFLFASIIEGGTAIDRYDFIMIFLAYPTTYWFDVLLTKLFGLGIGNAYWDTFVSRIIAGTLHYLVLGICMWIYIKWLKRENT